MKCQNCGIFLIVGLTCTSLQLVIFKNVKIHWESVNTTEKQVQLHQLRETNRENTFKVPNIVHYIWYMDTSIEMRFDKAIGVLSAKKYIKPEVIYFHTNREPHGKYFEKLKQIPGFKVIHREAPTKVFNKIDFETTLSNFDRVKILLEYGGIYLDFDVLVTQSFDDLRKYRCTLGTEIDFFVCAGIIICGKDEPFLHIWLNSFYDDYKPKWAYNSGHVSTRLVKRYPDLIHIENNKLHRPNYIEMKKIWGSEKFEWRENYAIHTWIRVAGLKAYPNETSIKTMNSTYGRIARDVYYGSENIIID